MRSRAASVAAMLATLAGAWACRSGSGLPPSGVKVPAGGEVTLAVGQSALLDDTGLRVSFEGVHDDSRCPTSLQCVWEGDAAVVVSVDGRGARAAYDLHTSGRSPREVTHDGVRIALVRLDPARSAAGPVPLADYRATLSLAR